MNYSIILIAQIGRLTKFPETNFRESNSRLDPDLSFNCVLDQTTKYYDHQIGICASFSAGFVNDPLPHDNVHHKKSICTDITQQVG